MKKILSTVVLCLLLVGCTSATPGQQSATEKDRQVANQQLDTFQNNQPVPVFEYSQLRQNLIEIETAQANSTATTSFMFTKATNGSTGSLAMSCPSIGFPIPATYSLTNPTQGVVVKTPVGDDAGVTIDQLEANGVFTGDTTGTYVICVNAKGKAYPVYHEGEVTTVAGPAVWNNEIGQIELSGDPSVKFSTSK